MLLKVISNSITLTSVHSVLHLELVFPVISYCEIYKSHYVSPWPCHSVLLSLAMSFYQRFLLSVPPLSARCSQVNGREPRTFSHYVPLLFPTYFKIEHCLSAISQQAITAISAPGEMIALWIKFGGKTVLPVASGSAIKQEWCSEVLVDWISCCW